MTRNSHRFSVQNQSKLDPRDPPLNRAPGQGIDGPAQDAVLETADDWGFAFRDVKVPVLHHKTPNCLGAWGPWPGHPIRLLLHLFSLRRPRAPNRAALNMHLDAK